MLCGAGALAREKLRSWPTTQDLFWIVIPSVARDLQFAASKSTDEKVPDADYQSTRNSLEEEVAAIMAEIARLEQVAGQVA